MMVGVKSFFVVLLVGVAPLVMAMEVTIDVDSMADNSESMKPLPTLEEYIQAKRNKRNAGTTRGFTAPPYIGEFYRNDSRVANSSVVNCQILKVGIHAVKASNGVEFRRHEVVETDCVNAGPANLQTKNFFQCADKAASSRYNSFMFTLGSCKGFRIWRHRKIAACVNSPFKGGNVAILYVATKAFSDYNSVALGRYPLVVKSTFHGVGRVLLHWTAPDRCSVVAKYRINSVSGTEERRGGMTEYFFSTFNKTLCNDTVAKSNKTITVVAYDFDNVEVFRFNRTPNTTGGTRYVLSDGSCVLYDPAVALDEASSNGLCEGVYATLPTASPAMPFADYKKMIAAVGVPVEDHFTGAVLTSNLTWQWAEMCAPVASTEWDLLKTPNNFTLGACSTSSGSDGYALLQEDCDASQSVVCHDAPYIAI